MGEAVIAEQFPRSIEAKEFFEHMLTAASKPYRQLEYKLYETTPMFSKWPMRKKWEKYGDYWGYVLLYEERKDRSNRDLPVQCPPIQLAYAKIGEQVLQIAYWSDLKLAH